MKATLHSVGSEPCRICTEPSHPGLEHGVDLEVPIASSPCLKTSVLCSPARRPTWPSTAPRPPTGRSFRRSISMTSATPSAAPCPKTSTPASDVIDQLIAGVEPAVVATTGPRYFGFVIGGALAAPTAAELLVAGLGPAGLQPPVVTFLCGRRGGAGAWLTELLGLPHGVSRRIRHRRSSRQHCLPGGRPPPGARRRRLGRRARRPDGGAPRPGGRHGRTARHHRPLAPPSWPRRRCPRTGRTMPTGQRCHRGRRTGQRVLEAGYLRSDHRVPPGRQREHRRLRRPGRRVPVVHERGGWVHVDGAFGLWAAASPTTRHLVAGLETGRLVGHRRPQWLNVPYDSGYAFCADPDAHAAAMAYSAAYLVEGGTSRRAVSRGLRPRVLAPRLGVWRPGPPSPARTPRDGRARRTVLRIGPAIRRPARGRRGVEIGNDVVLNQVLVRFGNDDATTDRVVEACSSRVSVGWDPPRGTVVVTCESRCRAGVRLKRMWIAPWPLSSEPLAPEVAGQRCVVTVE